LDLQIIDVIQKQVTVMADAKAKPLGKTVLKVQIVYSRMLQKLPLKKKSTLVAAHLL